MKPCGNDLNSHGIALIRRNHNRHPRHQGPFVLLASLAAILAILSLTGCTGNSSAPGTRPATPSTADPSASSVGLVASSMKVSFGNVPLGTTAPHNLSITNTGTAPVNISATTTSGSAFTVVAGTAPSIPAGQSTTVQIQFAPKAAGVVTADLVVTGDASGSALTISLSGTGVQPSISIAPANISFGNVSVGFTTTQPVTVSNTGEDNLDITQSAGPGAGFSLSGLTLPLTVLPGQSAKFSLSFTPTAPGSVRSSLALVSNAPTSPVVIGLSGDGVPGLVIATSTLAGGQAQVSYTVQLGATGGTTPYFWSVSSGNLPAGLTLTSGGAISGTPAQSGSHSFSLSVKDSSSSPQTASQAFSINIIAATPTLQITTTSLPAGQVQAPYTAQLSATGGAVPYNWSVSGNLPAGLTLSSTGAISGTPAQSGNLSFSVSVRDSGSSPQTASQAFSINLTAAAPTLQITTSTLPTGQVQAPYTAQLSATGGAAPYNWSVSSANLPAGLTLSSTGAISGTPAQSGNLSFSVSVRDSGSSPQTASQAFSINITVAAPTLKITTSTLPAGQVQAAYTAQLGATGGTAPDSWSVIVGSLPPGLTLNASTGGIAGAPSQAGAFPFTVQVKDSSASPQAAAQAFSTTISVPPLQITTSSVPSGAVGVSYNATLAAVNGLPPYTWSLHSGQFPPGLSLQGSTGQISGTPSQTGAFSFSVQASDSAGQTASGTFNANIAPASAPVVSNVSPTSGPTSGGTTVTVAGSNFQAGAAVLFGGVEASSVTVNNPTQIQVVTPAHIAGTIDVTVRNADSQSSTLSSGFVYAAISITYYVATIGNDANACTVSAPCLTIARAETVSAAGDTINIAAGTYRLSTGSAATAGWISAKANQTFVGPACTPAVAKCTTIISGGIIIGPSAVADGSDWKVTGQNQQGTVSLSSAQCETGFTGCIYPEDLFYDGVPLLHINSTTRPSLLTGQWWFDYTNHIIYFHDTPSGHTVETSILSTMFSNNGVNGVTVDSLTIQEFATRIQWGAFDPVSGNPSSVLGINWTLKNGYITLNHATGVRVNYGMQIINNVFDTNGNEGIGGGTAPDAGLAPSNILVQGNTVTNNNYARVSPGFGAGGIKFGRVIAIQIIGNIVKNNEGEGIHCDVECVSPIYDGNVVADNATGSGIQYEISKVSALFRNNTIEHNGTVTSGSPGFNLLSQVSAGVEAYCNVVEISGNQNGMVFSSGPRGASFLTPNSGALYASTGNNFHHNTLTWDAGATGYTGGAQFDTTNEPNFFANNTPPDHNEYHIGSLSTTNFRYDNNNTGSNTAKTFAQFQAAGADVHGTVDTNITSGFPTVNLPTPSGNLTINGPVAMTATASDGSGISKVEFYVDWTLQTTVKSSPYNFIYNTGSIGNHVVAAKAYSTAGVSACWVVPVTNTIALP